MNQITFEIYNEGSISINMDVISSIEFPPIHTEDKIYAVQITYTGGKLFRTEKVSQDELIKLKAQFNLHSNESEQFINNKHQFHSIPEEINYHNACTDRCDLINGPCACGSWHTFDDMLIRLWKEGDAVRVVEQYYNDKNKSKLAIKSRE